MAVRPLLSVTLVMAEQFWKAFVPMDVMLLGITTDLRAEQLIKAL